MPVPIPLSTVHTQKPYTNHHAGKIMADLPGVILDVVFDYIGQKDANRLYSPSLIQFLRESHKAMEFFVRLHVFRFGIVDAGKVFKRELVKVCHLHLRVRLSRLVGDEKEDYDNLQFNVSAHLAACSYQASQPVEPVEKIAFLRNLRSCLCHSYLPALTSLQLDCPLGIHGEELNNFVALWGILIEGGVAERLKDFSLQLGPCMIDLEKTKPPPLTKALDFHRFTSLESLRITSALCSKSHGRLIWPHAMTMSDLHLPPTLLRLEIDSIPFALQLDSAFEWPSSLQVLTLGSNLYSFVYSQFFLPVKSGIPHKKLNSLLELKCIGDNRYVEGQDGRRVELKEHYPRRKFKWLGEFQDTCISFVAGWIKSCLCNLQKLVITERAPMWLSSLSEYFSSFPETILSLHLQLLRKEDYTFEKEDEEFWNEVADNLVWASFVISKKLRNLEIGIADPDQDHAELHCKHSDVLVTAWKAAGAKSCRVGNVVMSSKCIMSEVVGSEERLATYTSCLPCVPALANFWLDYKSGRLSYSSASEDDESGGGE